MSGNMTFPMHSPLSFGHLMKSGFGSLIEPIMSHKAQAIVLLDGWG